MGLKKNQDQTAEERANLYKLLSLIYIKEPVQELLELLNEVGIRSAKRLEDLVIEYTRLFIGPGKHISPYESVHRKEDGGCLWGESTVQVKRIIETAGLKYKNEFSGVPDHIGAEFEFMQKLIGLEIDAIEKKDTHGQGQSQKIQKKFFNEHLVHWVPIFCNKIKQTARLDFYKQAAELTEDFMAKEKMLFDGE